MAMNDSQRLGDATDPAVLRETAARRDGSTLINRRRHASSLTAAIRVFIVAYFRAAATEEGHASVGHGTLYRAALGGGRRGVSGASAW